MTIDQTQENRSIIPTGYKDTPQHRSIEPQALKLLGFETQSNLQGEIPLIMKRLYYPFNSKNTMCKMKQKELNFNGELQFEEIKLENVPCEIIFPESQNGKVTLEARIQIEQEIKSSSTILYSNFFITSV